MRWFGALFIIIIGFLFNKEINGQQLPDTSIHYKHDSITISNIIIEGNKITRDKIILREVEFEPGEKLSEHQLDSLIKKSSQNLLNRSLFNFATIDKQIDGDQCVAVINVTERWYIWPIPIIDFAVCSLVFLGE